MTALARTIGSTIAALAMNLANPRFRGRATATFGSWVPVLFDGHETLHHLDEMKRKRATAACGFLYDNGICARGREFVFKQLEHVEINTNRPEPAIQFHSEVPGFRARSTNRVEGTTPGPHAGILYPDLGDTGVELISALRGSSMRQTQISSRACA